MVANISFVSDSGVIGSVVSLEFDRFHLFFRKDGDKFVSDTLVGAIVSTVGRRHVLPLSYSQVLS